MDTQDAPITPEVQAAMAAFVQQMHERMARRECIMCGTALAAQLQVGRCIYAEPCGCRQGQGHLMNADGKRVTRMTYAENR